MNRLLLILTASAFLTFAQDSSAIRLRIVKGGPFSAQVRTESVQTLPDGNRVTRTSSAAIARDSEGRTRREQVDGNGIVFIHDPVIEKAYVLDARNHSARQFAISSGEGESSERSGPALKSENLGTNVFEGYPAEGTRIKRMIAAGEAGNEKPIEVVSEAWYSSDLQIVLSSRTVDPRAGETTYKVTGINRAEPDPALFQVPTNYQMHNSIGK